LSDLRQAPFFSEFLNENRKILEGVPEDIVVAQACRDLIKFLVNDVISETEKRLKITNKKPLPRECVFKKDQVSFTKITSKKIKKLKEFLFYNYYRSPRINLMREKAAKVIEKLFSYYVKNLDKLPESWEKNPHYKYFEDENVRKLNLVGDFVAGMTDKYALDIYEQIEN
jgi:dGTPase